jgi:hypothetical protein
VGSPPELLLFLFLPRGEDAVLLVLRRGGDLGKDGGTSDSTKSSGVGTSSPSSNARFISSSVTTVAKQCNKGKKNRVIKSAYEFTSLFDLT